MNSLKTVLVLCTGNSCRSQMAEVILKHDLAGRVRALLTDCGDEAMGVFAIYPPGRHLAARVRVLIDHLAAHFRHSRWNA